MFSRMNMCYLYFCTDKESKKLLFNNNNIGMKEENKIDNKFNIENKKIRK